MQFGGQEQWTSLIFNLFKHFFCLIKRNV
jgi:hypothetical protein